MATEEIGKDYLAHKKLGGTKGIKDSEIKTLNQSGKKLLGAPKTEMDRPSDPHASLYRILLTE